MSYSFEIRDLSPDQIRTVADIMETKDLSFPRMISAGITPVMKQGLTVDGKHITPDRLIAFEPIPEEVVS